MGRARLGIDSGFLGFRDCTEALQPCPMLPFALPSILRHPLLLTHAPFPCHLPSARAAAVWQRGERAARAGAAANPADGAGAAPARARQLPQGAVRQGHLAPLLARCSVSCWTLGAEGPPCSAAFLPTAESFVGLPSRRLPVLPAWGAAVEAAAVVPSPRILRFSQCCTLLHSGPACAVPRLPPLPAFTPLSARPYRPPP